MTDDNRHSLQLIECICIDGERNQADLLTSNPHILLNYIPSNSYQLRNMQQRYMKAISIKIISIEMTGGNFSSETLLI